MPAIKTALVAITLCLALPASAANPKALIEGKYAEIQKIIETDKTDDGVRQKLEGVLQSFTDWEEFSRMTLKADWDKLSAAQRKTFVERYQKLLQKSYTKHFKAGQEIDLSFRGDPKVIGDKAMVMTNVKSGKTRAEVDYKMHLVNDAYRVYDIVVDQVSLMRNYRKQFARIMKRDGFDVLIQKIDKKLARTDDDSDDIE